MSIRPLALAMLIALAACKKEPAPVAKDAEAPAAVTSAASSAAAADAGKPAEGAPSTWTLKYTLAPATMDIPDGKDWSHTKFKNDETKYLGEGTLQLNVTSEGRVTGQGVGGALGDTLVDGFFDGTQLTATVRRKDPADDGPTGTIMGTVKGGALEGTMKVAEGNAAVVREAKVSGTKSS